MNNETHSYFQVVLKLGIAIIIIKLLFMALLVPAVWSDLEQISLFHAIQDKSFLQQNDFDARADASDQMQMTIGIVQVCLSLLSLVLWFVWTYRSSKLARMFGAQNMQHSAGGSIGWYFVPFANLVMPAIVMYEILAATVVGKTYRNPDENRRLRPSAAIVVIWWMLFLVSALADRLSLSAGFSAETPAQLIESTQLTLVADIASFPSFLLDLVLVLSLRNRQKEAFQRFSQETAPLANSSDRFAPRYT